MSPLTRRCPVCGRSIPTSSLLEHLQGHSTKVLAEELLVALDKVATQARRADLQRRCTKVPFPDEEEATRALLSTWGVEGRKEIRVYRCGLCKRWHLTSKDIAEILRREMEIEASL